MPKTLFGGEAVHCTPAAHSNNAPLLSGCVRTAERSKVPRPTALLSGTREESIVVVVVAAAAVEVDDNNVGKTIVITGSLIRGFTSSRQHYTGDMARSMRQIFMFDLWSRCFRSAFAANYFLLVGIIPLDLYGGYIRVMSLRCT